MLDRLPDPKKVLVSAYRGVGLLALGGILLGVASYLGTHLFFLVNSSWLAPTVISPSDERVLQLSAQLAQQASLRDKLAAERLELTKKLEDMDRVVRAQETIGASFGRAIAEDVTAKRAEVKALEVLADEYRSAKPGIRDASDGFADLSKERLETLARVHLVDAETTMGARYQLSQIAHSNLSLDDKEAAIASRLTELRRDIRALETLATQPKKGALSYDTLRMEQERTRAQLELARARDGRDSVKQAIAAADRSLERYDRLLRSIQDSPYLQAVEKRLTVAFVPYGNLSRVARGEPLYGCSLGVFWCHDVGRVVAVLDGEVAIHHPIRNQVERGQMVQIDLKEASWAEQKVLYAGRAPLFI